MGSSTFSMASSIVSIVYLLFIGAIIFAVVYLFKLMKERNNYLRDIRDELRNRNL